MIRNGFGGLDGRADAASSLGDGWTPRTRVVVVEDVGVMMDRALDGSSARWID